jgi:hypothetical protein
MGKKLGKSEKLDLILSELAKLRGEFKKLVRDRAAEKVKPRSVAGRPKKLPKRTGAGKEPDSDVTLAKPVLFQAPQAPQPNNRTASQVAARGSTPVQTSGKPR